MLRSRWILAACVAGVTACATASPRPGAAGAAAASTTPACAAPSAPMIRSTLYFGLHYRDGREIAQSDWESFLADELTPRFAGLTVLEARGQWTDASHHVVREPSRVVVVLHADSAAARARIVDVVRRYRERFDQESVLWEAAAVCAAF